VRRRPLLSIVVANYNYGRFLAEAIESVLAQSCQEFELIICDGGSTDNSVEVIKHYARGLSANTALASDASENSRIVWWCSEKDRGQSHAFNKGFSHATGRFLTWLNADDVLLPGTVERLKSAASTFEKCDWFVGGCLWLDPDMQVIRCVRACPFSEARYRCGMVSAWGPSSFFSKGMLDAVGGVDERFHYMMDSDLWLKFAVAGYRYRDMPGYAYGLRLHPDAKMSGHHFSGSAQQDPNHFKWQQLREEAHLMRQGREFAPFTPFMRLLTIKWKSRAVGALNQMCMKGKHYARINYMGKH
jgi:glycosyltransferase involved in cell wall biosynthesis